MAKRGPRTEAGRRRVALNALSHGALARTPVIPGEDDAEWRRHLQGFHDSLAPQTPFEASLADRIAFTVWRIRRIEVYETEALKLAHRDAEERAATRILYPAGGAVTLRGASAATLIQDRIQRLRRLADLVLHLRSREPSQLTADDIHLLYEGLDLAVSAAADPTGVLQRQLLRGLAPTQADDQMRKLATNMAGLFAELEEIVGEIPRPASGPDAQDPRPPSPATGATLVRRYPIELVVLAVWPEIRRLEAELPDLDAIDRARTEALILEAASLEKLIRYEAHLATVPPVRPRARSRPGPPAGRPAPLARLDVQLVPRPAATPCMRPRAALRQGRGGASHPSPACNKLPLPCPRLP